MSRHYEEPPLWFQEACCEINKAMGDEEFVDNHRCYRKKDELGKKAYDKAIESGCCGSSDWEYTDKHGDVWIVGCNYGH